MENANMGIGALPAIPSGGDTPRTLREATEEFESLFVAQMMRSMRSTVPDSGLLGAGGGQQIFREMLDHELSRRAAYSGGFGIGEMLYRQLGGTEDGPAADHTQESETNASR
jgi:peptidoglycan hydrolase FlgJ